MATPWLQADAGVPRVPLPAVLTDVQSCIRQDAERHVVWRNSWHCEIEPRCWSLRPLKESYLSRRPERKHSKVLKTCCHWRARPQSFMLCTLCSNSGFRMLHKMLPMPPGTLAPNFIQKIASILTHLLRNEKGHVGLQAQTSTIRFTSAIATPKHV